MNKKRTFLIFALFSHTIIFCTKFNRDSQNNYYRNILAQTAQYSAAKMADMRAMEPDKRLRFEANLYESRLRLAITFLDQIEIDKGCVTVQYKVGKYVVEYRM